MTDPLLPPATATHGFDALLPSVQAQTLTAGGSACPPQASSAPEGDGGWTGEFLLDDADVGLLEGRRPYLGTNGYAYVTKWNGVRWTPATVHSLVLGSWRGMHVDHINGNKKDNRRANLRVVTPSINQVNRKSLNRNNSSGHRGVVKRKNRWIAQIQANGRMRYLGMFKTLEEAIAVRRNAELELFGEECPRCA